MNISQLINIKSIFSSQYTTKLSPRISYKIFKLCKFIEEEEQFFDTERSKLIEQYAEHTDTGEIKTNNQGYVQIQKDKIEEAQMKLDELTSIEVELPHITFTLDELSDIKLSVQDIAILEPLLDFSDKVD